MDAEEPPGERPRWSFLWQLRIQRTGRNRPPTGPDGANGSKGFARWFPFAVLAALIVEIAVLIWLGVLPR